MISLDRTAKKIMDTLAAACHVPIRHVCILNHDNDHFKAYVHGTSWYGQRVFDIIKNTWGVKEENIKITKSPDEWWIIGSTGYVIEVQYE